MDPSSQSPGPSGKSTPQPPSGKSTPSSRYTTHHSGTTVSWVKPLRSWPLQSRLNDNRLCVWAPQRRAADGGSGPPLPDPETHDHQRPPEEVPDQAHGAEQRADGQRAGTDPEAAQPGAQKRQRQDALLPDGVTEELCKYVAFFIL